MLALCNAAVDQLRKGRGHVGSQLVQLLWRQRLGVPQCALKNFIRTNAQEGLGHLDAAGISVVEGRGKQRRFAGRVELEVNGALGEDCAGEVGEGGVDLDLRTLENGGLGADDVTCPVLGRFENKAGV